MKTRWEKSREINDIINNLFNELEEEYGIVFDGFLIDDLWDFK